MKMSQVYFDWEIQRLLTDMAYIDLGLVPLSHYPNDIRSSLRSSLEKLDPDDARRAKRKFRKLLKKAWKKDRNPTSFGAKQYSVKWYIVSHYVKAPIIDNDE